ncbi:MAG: hypothetical protein ACLFWR_13775, partial [Acidimicrobiales bacterium]
MSATRARRELADDLGTKLAVVAGSTVALGAVVVWVGATYGVTGVVFAFAVNWLAMCWMGTAGRVLGPSLPERYFEIRGFERSGRLYEALGVRLVKRAVRRGPLHLFNPQLRMPAEPTSARLHELEQRMREPETGHAWLFATMALVASHAAVHGWWPAAAWTMAFNVALNAYPIMLQRYNRRWLLERIERDQEP